VVRVPLHPSPRALPYRTDLPSTVISFGGASVTLRGALTRRDSCAHSTGFDPAYQVAEAAPSSVVHGLLFVLSTWTAAADATTLPVTVPVVVVWLFVVGLAVQGVTRPTDGSRPTVRGGRGRGTTECEPDPSW